ncbi:MAG: SMI1/KNR4 family protein [Oscillospiraceae bacterium]|nr:SMI1/KNR4 family protein [Oscillospiraceae bacterium]
MSSKQEITQLFEDIHSACSLLIKYDKSVFNPGADSTQIDEFENRTGIKIPDDYRTLLMLSDGAQVLGRTATLFGIDDIGFSAEELPVEYVKIGELAGDGEILCFNNNNGTVVTIYENKKFVSSIKSCLKYCLEQCLDGLFMIGATNQQNIFRSYEIREKLTGFLKIRSLDPQKKTHEFMESSDEAKVKLMDSLPVMMQGLVYNTIPVAECIKYVNYLRTFPNFKADNFIRGLRRRVLDNYFNRERQLLDNGKATYNWDRYQLKELYNFDPAGMKYVNAGIVYRYNNSGDPDFVVLTDTGFRTKVVKKKLKISHRTKITEHPEFAFEINDIVIGDGAK